MISPEHKYVQCIHQLVNWRYIKLIAYISVFVLKKRDYETFDCVYGQHYSQTCSVKSLILYRPTTFVRWLLWPASSLGGCPVCQLKWLPWPISFGGCPLVLVVGMGHQFRWLPRLFVQMASHDTSVCNCMSQNFNILIYYWIIFYQCGFVSLLLEHTGIAHLYVSHS